MGKFKGFDSVKLVKPQQSVFDLSNVIRTSTRMGRLTPINIVECLPHDMFKGGCELICRIAPMLAPLFDNIQIFVHHFFVPNRLLWEDWEEFIAGDRLGPTDPEPIPPYADINDAGGGFMVNFAPSSLADYLGVPIITGDWGTRTIDLMPFASYQLVYQEYYRDRNFEDDTVLDYFPLASGEQSGTITNAMTALRTRYYMRDYFTSALPFTQRGDEVLMPLQGQGSVTYLDTSLIKRSNGTDPTTNSDPLRTGTGASTENLQLATDGNARIENIDDVFLETSTVSINDFRAAYALQVWLERNALAGSRYTESIQAHFGVRPQDQRLQRPEYIGGYRIPVKISEVVSTAYSNDGEDVVPLANMAGHGIAYGNSDRFRYFCVEHGFIISILSIMNAPAYHQGLPRMFYKRRSFLDYVWPTFAKLGEQPVDTVELYMNTTTYTPGTDGEYPLFGYQSRYADWKINHSGNRGAFHGSLLFWTLTRNFSSAPVLGQAFNVFDDASQNRIFAVNGESDNFWLYVNNRLTVRRSLPYFGTPNTLGFV